MGDRLAVVERIWASNTPINIALDPGDLQEIDATAVGKCVLAYHDEAHARRLIGDRLKLVASDLEETRKAEGVRAGRDQGSQVVGTVTRMRNGQRLRNGQPIEGIGAIGHDLGQDLALTSKLANRLLRAANLIGQSPPWRFASRPLRLKAMLVGVGLATGIVARGGPRAVVRKA